MRREAALKEFVPAAVMPERSPFFMGEGIFPSKTFRGRGEPDAEPFFVSSMELSGRKENGRRSARAKGASSVAVRAYRELKSRRFERP